MKGSFQKLKINRKSSATSKERPLPAEKEERLQELRQKIEKDRENLRKTGKRFSKHGENISSETSALLKQQQTNDKNATNAPFLKKQSKTTQANTQQFQAKIQASLPQRKNVKLAQLIPTPTSKSSPLESSQVFLKEMHEQKTRNQEVQKFLESVSLVEFADELINMGYDELSVLVEVKAEELNFLMMRANQQKKLMAALQKYRESSGLQDEQRSKPLIGKPSAFKTKTKMETEKPNKTSSLPFRPKSALTQTSTIPTNNSSLFNNSFFSSIGGQEWSMESLIRRACSSCYKIHPSNQLQQKKECFYCRSCLQAEEDLLGMTLSDSMVRDYS